MKRTLIGTLEDSIGRFVRVCGWVQAVRHQKNVLFVILRDHTGVVQTTHKRTDPLGETERTIERLTRESAIEITGTLVRNERVNLRQMELIIERIEVVSLAEAELPVDEQSALDIRLDWKYLDLRRPKNLLVFRVQTAIEHAMREFWASQKFVEIHSPKFMGSASESGGELFRVDYFDRFAYLAQSPQFYKQMAMAAGFDRVFEIGPVFRANPSFTSRHDTEFTSVDVEVSWTQSHEDIMTLEELWLRHVLEVIQDRYGREISDTFGIEVVPPKIPFPRISMADAYNILGSMGHTIGRETKGDLDPEGERLLSDHVGKEHGHEFVFVTDYPISARPFYHMRYDGRPGITMSYDLLWKGLEITTGAQREHRYDRLITQAKEKGIDLEPIQYYLDFFRYGCPPHGGFGFGLSRMLMILLGFKNVREVTFLYRGPNRLFP